MIDLSRTKFIVFAWPDHKWPVELVHWIESLTSTVEPPDERYRHSMKKRDIVAARNTAIRDVALGSPEQYEHFIFVDADVRPGPLSKAFLEIEADVVSCELEMRGKHAWMYPESFHDSLWTTSRKVLESIDPPWFEWTYDESKCNLLGCLCQSFRAKAIEKGFSIAHGGWAEHDSNQSWCE